jgi:uncharacterized protein YkwD
MDKSEHYRRRALWRLAGAAVVLAIVGGFIFFGGGQNDLQKLSSIGNADVQTLSQQFSKTFSAPPPLIATSSPIATIATGTVATGTGAGEAGNTTTAATAAPASAYVLTREGIITDTNAQRAQNGGLPPLAEDQTLNTVATLRLQDMFAKQYFAHFSPSSSSAQTVAATVGYSYIALGENLALGNFVGDSGVVTAWMNSPGHRANILGQQYDQIGVAVGQGMFQGDNVWIAVQVFGRPLSDCPAPDNTLKNQITDNNSQLVALQTQLAGMKNQVSAMDQSSPTYDAEVNNYNATVSQYNALAAEVKLETDQYNTEVDVYNRCVTVSQVSAVEG